jgi:hypothetical protein
MLTLRLPLSAFLSRVIRPPAIMTSTEIRLRSASAVAGYVRSVAAGVLMHGLLRSHWCGLGDPGTTFTHSNV